MIDLSSFHMSELLSGVALAGGMLHKIAGPNVDKAVAMVARIGLNLLENKIMAAQPGMTAPVNLSTVSAAPASTSSVAGVSTGSNNVLMDVEAGLSAALAGGSAVFSAVTSASSETAKITAGLQAFLSFATPILDAVEPGYSDLITGIGNGVMTIIGAIENHKSTTAAKTA
jgi:hypothetical protein